MENIFTDYFSSFWGVSTNLIIFVVFSLIAYQRYAKRWSSITGKYFTQGHITWSQYIPENKKVLISYAYSVNGRHYNGEIHAPPFSKERVLTLYPKGKNITVYYAKKSAGFSKAETPPTLFQILSTVIAVYLILPVLFINIPSIFLYWLFRINN